MQGSRKLLSPVWQGGGTPRYFCNCSFQEGLSPMILQVRIARDLGRHFFASAHCKGLADFGERQSIAPPWGMSPVRNRIIARRFLPRCAFFALFGDAETKLNPPILPSESLLSFEFIELGLVGIVHVAVWAWPDHE